MYKNIFELLVQGTLNQLAETSFPTFLLTLKGTKTDTAPVCLDFKRNLRP